MTNDDEATWHTVVYSGSEVTLSVTAVLAATRGTRGDVVPPVEQVFDKADDGSVMIVRKFRGTELNEVDVWVPDDSG